MNRESRNREQWVVTKTNISRTQRSSLKIHGLTHEQGPRVYTKNQPSLKAPVLWARTKVPRQNSRNLDSRYIPNPGTTIQEPEPGSHESRNQEQWVIHQHSIPNTQRLSFKIRDPTQEARTKSHMTEIQHTKTQGTDLWAKIRTQTQSTEVQDSKPKPKPKPRI